MDVALSGESLSTFSKIIFHLSKIGTEIIFFRQNDVIVLSVVNSSQSAFGCIHLNARFFTTLRQVGSDKEALKIQTKPLVNIFRLNRSDKTIESVRIRTDSASNEGDRLCIQLFCTHGVIKTHRLSYEAVEPFSAVYEKNDHRPHWKASPKFIHDLIAHFQSNLEDVTICCSPNRFTVTTFASQAPGLNDDEMSRELETHINLDVTEFEEFYIPFDIQITMNLKDLRRVLSFAEVVESPVMCYLSRVGAPAVFSFQLYGGQRGNLGFADMVVTTFQSSDDMNDGEVHNNTHGTSLAPSTSQTSLNHTIGMMVPTSSIIPQQVSAPEDLPQRRLISADEFDILPPSPNITQKSDLHQEQEVLADEVPASPKMSNYSVIHQLNALKSTPYF